HPLDDVGPASQPPWFELLHHSPVLRHWYTTHCRGQADVLSFGHGYSTGICVVETSVIVPTMLLRIGVNAEYWYVTRTSAMSPMETVPPQPTVPPDVRKSACTSAAVSPRVRPCFTASAWICAHPWL